MYLTFEEYTNLGFIDTPPSLFPRFEREARQSIRYMTANKSDIAIEGTNGEDIKYLMCLLIDLANEQHKALSDLSEGMNISRKGIASESVTDHSVSFKQQSEDTIKQLEDTHSQRTNALIRKHLIWTGLLYRGL